MYLCICKAVTVSEVREVAEAGVRDFDELAERFSLGDEDNCGTCLSVLEDLLLEIGPPAEGARGDGGVRDACARVSG